MPSKEEIPLDIAGRLLYLTSKVGIPGMVVAFLLWEGHNFLTAITDKLAIMVANQGTIMNLLNNYCSRK